MSAAIELQIRTPLNPSDPIKLTESDLIAGATSSGPSALDLIPWEVKVSSPYFGARTVRSKAGAPTAGSEILVLALVLAVAGFAIYGLARAVK